MILSEHQHLVVNLACISDVKEPVQPKSLSNQVKFQERFYISLTHSLKCPLDLKLAHVHHYLVLNLIN
jgi:hypothetical protein